MRLWVACVVTTKGPTMSDITPEEREDWRFDARGFEDSWSELGSCYRRIVRLLDALEKSEATSKGRLKVLFQKVDELRAEWQRAENAESQRFDDDWQPIATAPQVHPLNGGDNLLLGWNAPGINEWISVVGQWRGEWYSGADRAYPTHWRKLPNPPRD